MSEEYDTFAEEPKEQKKESFRSEKSDDHFLGMGYNLLSKINFKVGIFLFFIGMLIFSDIFIDKVLTLFSNTTFGECTTTKGTVIQLIFLVLGYIIIDVLDKTDIL